MLAKLAWGEDPELVRPDVGQRKTSQIPSVRNAPNMLVSRPGSGTRQQALGSRLKLGSLRLSSPQHEFDHAADYAEREHARRPDSNEPAELLESRHGC